VLACDGNDLLLARITTHEPRDPFDVPLVSWADVGLPKPSTIRLLKLVSIDTRLIHHSIGVLPHADRIQLSQIAERLGQSISANLRE
jgi:mRNA interferase MazF